jgi:hypothetical protein
MPEIGAKRHHQSPRRWKFVPPASGQKPRVPADLGFLWFLVRWEPCGAGERHPRGIPKDY